MNLEVRRQPDKGVQVFNPSTGRQGQAECYEPEARLVPG